MKTSNAFAAFLLVAYCAPLLILGRDSYLLVHDNLDSVFVYFKTLADHSLFFAPSNVTLPNLGINIPREVLPGEWSLTSFLFQVFPAYFAYAAMFTLQHIVAFFSMRKLLLFLDKDNNDVANFSALTFSLLPFWPFGGGTVPLMPLVFWSFFSMRKNENVAASIVVFLLTPFFSSFYLASLYACGIMYLFLVYDLIKLKKCGLTWMWLSIHVAIYLMIDYRLVLHVLKRTFISQRLEMVASTSGASFNKILNLFLQGHYHSLSVHHLVILPAAVILLVWPLLRKKAWLKSDKLIVWSIGSAFALTLLSVFWETPFSDVFRKISLVKMMKLQRLYFLLPLIWSLSFYFVLASAKIRFGKKIVWGLVSIQCFVLFTYSDFLRNFQNERVSFNDFYATRELPELLKNISEDEKKNSRFMALGLHPSVLTYHNLKTLDFYLPHYPLVYKQLFVRFVKEEIKLDQKLERYIRESGIRLYFYSHEIGRFGGANPIKCPSDGVAMPLYDYPLIREYGGQFFVTACPVKGWDSVSEVTSSAYRTLYLYDLRRLNKPDSPD